MTNITFSIDDKTKALLEEEAKNNHVTVDVVINMAIENYLNEKQKRFQEARTYVRARYKDLYKRLA